MLGRAPTRSLSGELRFYLKWLLSLELIHASIYHRREGISMNLACSQDIENSEVDGGDEGGRGDDTKTLAPNLPKCSGTTTRLGTTGGCLATGAEPGD